MLDFAVKLGFFTRPKVIFQAFLAIFSIIQNFQKNYCIDSF